MANKAAKKATSKFDFSDSINAIKTTASTVNTQVKQLAGEVAGDLKENGEQLREYAVTPVKDVYQKAYGKVTEVMNREKLAKAAKNANDYALKTADEVVEGVMENTEKWQGVATKAVKGGLKLAAKQQTIVFDTLDTVKGQLIQGASRLKKLFSNN